MQVVVDHAGRGGGAGSAVAGDPLVAFGAVLGDGAHQMTISSTSSVRAAASSRVASPAPYRSRVAGSLHPIPGWVTDAVTAQVRTVWFWMSATRRWSGPAGGASWTSTPARTPGRSDLGQVLGGAP